MATLTLTEKRMGKINPYIKKCMEEDILPTVTGLALAMGVSKRTIHYWRTGHTTKKKVTKKEAGIKARFQKSYDLLMTHQEESLIQGGFSGRKNAKICQLILAANHGFIETKKLINEPISPGAKEKSEEAIDDYLTQENDNNPRHN